MRSDCAGRKPFAEPRRPGGPPPRPGRIEHVDLDRTPLGLIVTGCSQFPDGAPACACDCARRMDRRDRGYLEDRERVLVVLATSRNNAARIAASLAESLVDDWLAVE